ncbi:MAG TPA: peroxiredoxin-like family protein [candidate division Zixibacteria bacterium]|nr:peroxiredoxin-like family protein [candidate division Zixibacteria bacterium]
MNTAAYQLFKRIRPASQLALIGLLWLSVSSVRAGEPTAGSDADSSETLSAALDRMRERSLAQTPPELLKIGEDQRRVLRESGILRNARQVGDTAPSFSLNNAVGKTVDSKTLLAAGPLVVTFYRGAWCPFCNLQLAYMQEALPQITAAGAQFVAISPETPDASLTLREKMELEFEVLSDPGSAAAEAFGVAYTPTRALDSVVTVFGLDLRSRQNVDQPRLPLAATFVIDTAGVVRYAYLDVDYTRRAEPADILAVLQRL